MDYTLKIFIVITTDEDKFFCFLDYGSLYLYTQ